MTSTATNLWRRERDSNPRYGLTPYSGLANRRTRPLCDLSTTIHRRCGKAARLIVQIGRADLYSLKNMKIYYLLADPVNWPAPRLHGIAMLHLLKKQTSIISHRSDKSACSSFVPA